MDAKWNSIQKLNCPTQYVWSPHTIQLLATIFAESNLIGLRCHFIFYHKWRFMKELVRNMRDGFHFMPFHFIALHVTKTDKNRQKLGVCNRVVQLSEICTERNREGGTERVLCGIQMELTLRAQVITALFSFERSLPRSATWSEMWNFQAFHNGWGTISTRAKIALQWIEFHDFCVGWQKRVSVRVVRCTRADTLPCQLK